MIKIISLLFLSTSFCAASCMGPFCWDDTGASIAGVKFLGSFGGSGSPAGNDTAIQFNDNSSFGGSDRVQWDGNSFYVSVDQIQGVRLTPQGSLSIGNAGQTKQIIFDAEAGSYFQGTSLNVGGTGVYAPDSSIFSVTSSTQGFLLPRLSTGNVTSPIAGLVVFSTNTNKMTYYNGSTWVGVP